MLTLLTNLVLAARYYFQIKAATADYGLTKQIESDIEGLEASIASLRARGDPDAQRLADRLRERLLRAQGIAVAVSAARPPAPAASAPDDKGRPLLPANG